MAIDKAMFSLDKKEVILIKPSAPTPSTILSLSTIDNDLTLDLLCQTIYVFRGNLASSDDGHDLTSSKISGELDPAIVLREAISKALVYYYPLGGKLRKDTVDGRLRIDCEDVAVPFLEATANCELSAVHYLDGVSIDTAEQFVFDFPTGNSSVSHPLVVQVTKFACGGFTIGTGLSHSVCDGYGAAQFFRAMTELASGRDEPTVKPVWERERLQGKLLKEPIPFDLINKADAAVSPYLPTTDLSHEIFYIDLESIRRLKLSLMKENDHCPITRQESFTTVEALGAYVWRARTKALKLNYDGKTMFLLTMGIRHLRNPPLPEGYYGNAFVGSKVFVTVRDLIEGQLSEAAKLIKESKKMVSQDGYIESSLDMLETLRQQNFKAGASSGASMVLTEWRQLGLSEEVDFGWKQSVNVIPVPWNVFGYVDLCIFLPATKLDPSMKGGVRVLHSFPKAALPIFREEMEKLKLGGYTNP